MVLRVERKLFVIEQPISPAPPTDSEYLRSEMPYMMLHKKVDLSFMLETAYTFRHASLKGGIILMLHIVRSMMNLTTLPLSFWDYALETATRILNMVPTKKVDKTPYVFWLEKFLMSYLKVLVGCEVLVKRGRAEELEEIQDEDTSPYENTSEIPMEVEGFEPPHEEEPPVRRSVRTHRAPECLCLNVEIEEHSLGDLIEPANYKAVILDSEFNMWLDAMNAKMQSMIDNMVWVLVDLPPNCKTVGRKWHFEKKTNMDGIVHTYKAHLVAKGYTQLFGVDYEETFSPMANIRAIRILISIAAFYDYEIWQMDVKTAFLNGYLDEDIYMVFKIDNSKHGNIPMQERLDLNKTQGATTPREVKRMQNVPYASSIGSIMYSVFPGIDEGVDEEADEDDEEEEFEEDEDDE
ncbi:retrotransposon protein, putative, ty1-copia subclass [Tanacetum coccineum]